MGDTVLFSEAMTVAGAMAAKVGVAARSLRVQPVGSLCIV